MACLVGRVSPGSYVIGRRGYGISCVGFVVLGSHSKHNAVIIRYECYRFIVPYGLVYPTSLPCCLALSLGSRGPSRFVVMVTVAVVSASEAGVADQYGVFHMSMWQALLGKESG